MTFHPSFPDALIPSLTASLAALRPDAFAWRAAAKLELRRVQDSTFSGSAIYQVFHDQETFALRSWPNNAESIAKIGYWNQAAEHLKQAFQDNARNQQSAVQSPASLAGNRSVPISVPILWAGDPQGANSSLFRATQECIWTLGTWVPGRPIYPMDISPTLQTRLLEFLGNFHRSTANVGARLGASKGFEDRLQVCLDLEQGCHLSPPERLSLSTNLLEKCLGILETGHENARSYRRNMAAWCTQDWQLHWIVRDFWRENVLMDDEARFYLVDFGASRCDFPAFDLIRLLGTLRSSGQDWQRGWNTYQSHRGRQLELHWQEGMEIHQVSTLGAMMFWMRRLAAAQASGDVAFLTATRKQAEIRLSDLAYNWDSLSD